jgi:hypothetical protein
MKLEELLCIIMQIPYWRRIVHEPNDTEVQLPADILDEDMCYFLAMQAKQKNQSTLALKWFIFGSMKQDSRCLRELVPKKRKLQE